MKKFLGLFLRIMLVFSMAIVLTACGETPTYTATLDSTEIQIGGNVNEKTLSSTQGEISLRGPAYYDYSEMKLLVDGKEVAGFFTPNNVEYNSNYVYIGTVNPKKLTSNATITVSGLKDRYAYFTYVDFENTQEYKELKNRYESYLSSYTTNTTRANDESLSETERQTAATEARNAKDGIDYNFDGVMSGFEFWYATKAEFQNNYAIKLSAKDKAALTSAPLKDSVVEGTTIKYEDLISEDGYIAISYLSKIKNGNSAYQFEYTYRELTTRRDESQFTIGMLSIKSVLPLGRDTVALGADRNKSLHFNKVHFFANDEGGKPIYMKNGNYNDEDSVLSVESCRSYVVLDDDYAYTSYVKMGDLKSYTTYAIDPTKVEDSQFDLTIANPKFNEFVKLERAGFMVKNMGSQPYTIDNLGQLYIFTSINGSKWVTSEKRALSRITVGSNEPIYHEGEIIYINDNAKMCDIDGGNYIYYDTVNHSLTNLSDPNDDRYPNLIQVKRSMVEDITDEHNVLVTTDDIEYYYEVSSDSNGIKEFKASLNAYSFDIILDGDHDIDWTNAKVKVGGYFNFEPINLTELTGDYGSYEIKDYVIYLGGEYKNAKVLHCVLNLYKGGSRFNVNSAEDVYYPINYVNKSEISTDNLGFTAYTTFFIQVEGADFDNATNMVKIKGTCNLNPEAFKNYDNSNMAVFKNSDGTAYTVVSDIMEADVTDPYFVIYGQNLYPQDSSTISISNINTLTIEIKKDGAALKNINVKNYLTEDHKYYPGDSNIPMHYQYNGGYHFNETDGNINYHVIIHAEEYYDGTVGGNVGYISEIIIIVEDLGGTMPSQTLKGFYEFNFNIA